MLIHKGTMGILTEVFTGQHRLNATGVLVPINHQVRIEDYPDLNADDWWEVPSRSAVGKKAKIFYPNILPIVDEDGKLIDVSVMPREREDDATRAEQEIERAEQEQEAHARGYQCVGRLRQKNLLGFLSKKKE